MAQTIQQPSIFGRIGTGLGKGLAEQLPKEAERYRLSSGLKSFENEHQNLTPIQQLSRLSSIPGITPQMIQSFSDLAKIQNQGNAYRAGSSSQGQPGSQEPQASADITPVQQKQFLDNLSKGNFQNQQGNQQRGQPQQIERIPTENTFNPAAKTLPPWTPKRRDESIVDYISRGHLPEEARQLAANDEARELGLPPVLQQRRQEDIERTNSARNELDRQLETKFQKTGEGVYQDLPGEMKINLERAMQKALRTDPTLSVEDAAHEFSKRALHTSKAKNQLDSLSKTTGIESLLKGDQTLKKLKSYSDIFKDSGNSEEFYNVLRKNPEDGGFGLSPQGSATVSFPLNQTAKKYVEDFKPDYNRFKGDRVFTGANLPDQRKVDATARRAASDIGKIITADDSILAIVRSLSEKDPMFNQEAFFDQLNEDQDQLPLNDRQRRELAEGVENILPTWGDMLIFPWFRGTR